MITAVPKIYRGVRFRSTLEADWAANLDWLNIAWSYEPIAVDLGHGVRYLADFYLPTQNVWLEVKGPHNRRIDKPRRLADAVQKPPWMIRPPLVVIGRVPVAGKLTFHGIDTRYDVVIWVCTACGYYSFIDYRQSWECRNCLHSDGDDGGMPIYSGEFSFVHADSVEVA